MCGVQSIFPNGRYALGVGGLKGILREASALGEKNMSGRICDIQIFGDSS